MADAVLLVGVDNRIISINRVANRMLGIIPEHLIGANVKEIFPETELSTTHVFRRIKPTEFSLLHETTLVIGKQRNVPVQISSSTVRDARGQMIGVVMILRDISHRKRSEEKLRHMANHDSLTELPHRALLRV